MNTKKPVTIQIQNEKEAQAVVELYWDSYYAARRDANRKLVKTYIDGNKAALDDEQRGVLFTLPNDEKFGGKAYLMYPKWSRGLRVRESTVEA